MLQCVKHNFDQRNVNIAAFEIGKIHFKEEGNHQERLVASILLTGKIDLDHWAKSSKYVDFFDLKGMVENLLERFHLSENDFIPTHLQGFHPTIQAEVIVQGKQLGILGEIHPEQLKQLDIEKRVYFAQIDLCDLMTLCGQKRMRTMVPLSQFPGSTRDWTVPFKHTFPLGKVFKAIGTFRSQLLKGYSLLDLYEEEKFGNEKKNVTFRFNYRNDKQTIKQSEVEKEHERLIKAIQKKFHDFIL